MENGCRTIDRDVKEYLVQFVGVHDINQRLGNQCLRLDCVVNVAEIVATALEPLLPTNRSSLTKAKQTNYS